MNTNLATSTLIYGADRRKVDQSAIDVLQLKAQEILVAIDYATICTRELQSFWSKPLLAAPRLLGKEIIGRIIKVGNEVTTDCCGQPVSKGDRLIWTMSAYLGGKVKAFVSPARGNSTLNPFEKYSLQEQQRMDNFATHCVLSEGTSFMKLPESLSLQEAAPINCAQAIAAGAWRLAGDINGKNVLIAGVGMQGLAACAMAKAYGAKKIIAMDMQMHRLDRAAQFGADFGVQSGLPFSALQETLQQAGGVDIVIETTGAPSIMQQTVEVLNPEGIAVWTGTVANQPNTLINAEKMVRMGWTIKGLYQERPEDLVTAVRFMEKHQHSFPFATLVEEEYSLDEVPEVLDTANAQAYYRVGVMPN